MYKVFVHSAYAKAMLKVIQSYRYNSRIASESQSLDLPLDCPARNLGILPRIRLGHVRGDRIEAQAVVGEVDALEVGVNLPMRLSLILRAGQETASARQSAQVVVAAFFKVPAAGDGALGHVC